MRFWKFLVPSIILLAVPSFTSAHGVGQVYTLPIPLKYYLGAAGLAVALSFFIFAYILGTTNRFEGREKLFQTPWLKPLLSVLRILILCGVVLSIFAGIFGNPNSVFNFAPLFFWIVLILGFAVLSLFFGNAWDVLNPWKTLVRAINLGTGERQVSGWVGVVILFLLYWLELASRASFIPVVIGSVLFAYTFVNIWGNYFFKNWFTDGEVFSVLFRFIGRLSYFYISDDERSLVYSSPTTRLDGKPAKPYMLGVAAIILASTSFDSFKETILWVRIWNFFAIVKDTNLIVLDTLGFLSFLVPFIILYFLIIWIMQKLVGYENFQNLARSFVWILVPIGFGYMMAHYFTLMISTAPQILGLVFDPFGFGWNFLGSSRLVATNIILGAKFVWFMEIGFVVAAHVVGTLYAHILAVKIMPNPKKVLISQYPMLILMVAYTIGTLWLLSQPLTIAK